MRQSLSLPKFFHFVFHQDLHNDRIAYNYD